MSIYLCEEIFSIFHLLAVSTFGDVGVDNPESAFRYLCSETLSRCIFLLMLHDNCPNGIYFRSIRNSLNNVENIEE